MKKFIKSFKYAFEGILTGIKEEQNMKIHIIIMILVIIFGIMLKINTTEWNMYTIIWTSNINGINEYSNRKHS